MAATRCPSPPTPTTITVTKLIDRVTFQAPNYIASVAAPTEMYTGVVANISVHVNSTGNATVAIYSGATCLYWNRMEVVGDVASFQWAVDPGVIPGPVVLKAYFAGDNEFGYNETLKEVMAYANLLVATPEAYALDNVQLNSSYFEVLTGLPIPGAQARFELEGLSLPLYYQQGSGNYITTLNQNQYALVPGTYDLYLQATKSGYSAQNATVPLIVIPRPVEVSLNQTVQDLHAGDPVQFTVRLKDSLTKAPLSRPVNVTLSVYFSGNFSSQALITAYTFTGIISEGQYTWFVPRTAPLGLYDIALFIDSPFFTGGKIIPSGIMLSAASDSLPLWILFFVLIGGVGIIGISFYVRHMKLHARRSIKGVLIITEGGIPIIKRISPTFTRTDPALISGAVSGIVSLLKEITGSAIRTIELEGKYLHVIRKRTFWVVLLMLRHPSWISRTIMKFIADLEESCGSAIGQGIGDENFYIQIDDLLKKWFDADVQDLQFFQALQESLHS